MQLQNYIDEIKLELTGGLLELEIPDTTIARVVNISLREVQKYIDIPKLITVPFAKCIDLTNWKYDSIVGVYRTSGYNGDPSTGDSLNNDPMYMQQWMIFSNGGSMYNLDNYLMNFLSYNTLLQMRNTVSTDLSYKEDRQAKKLYINSAYDVPNMITIEYMPVYDSVEEIDDNYWIDIIKRLSLAQTKIILGRLRTYAKQSNALWELDGSQLLEEGNSELNAIREQLKDNLAFYYPVD